ncbi:fused MFS/spermidine synthase [Catenovulum sp. SM1970]|uniref:spermidine synthase n=1 Tax=Marinifaba aquimaris TaxID=2741323 RepID=UPI001572711B|nr:fused MFS/spermidine synthase [Marinifaba aquimaris]NTS76949.1 fused MFS/spermidine synthase [Marinifaba aquimaris]
MSKENDARWQVYENENYLWLTLNSTVQSVMDKTQHAALTFPHQAYLASALIDLPAKAEILELGLGGGTNARFLQSRFTDAHIKIIEKSGKVIELFERYFNPERQTFTLIHQDGPFYLAHTKLQFDLILSDLYSHQASAMNFLTETYLNHLIDRLNNQGYLYINMMPETLFDVELVKAMLCNFELELLHVSKIKGYRNHILLAQKMA